MILKSNSSFLLLLILLSLSQCDSLEPTTEWSKEDFLAQVSDENLSISIKKIDSLAKVNNYSDNEIGLLYYEKGRILGQLEKDVEAIGSLQKALNSFEKVANQKFIAKTNMLLGVSEGFLSNKENASKHTNKALSTFRSIHDKKGEGEALNSLAHIEFQDKNYAQSIAYVKQAIEIQLTEDDQEELSASYNNIGYILEQADDLEQASVYYKKAIRLNKQNKRLNSSPLRNLGYVYFLQNDIEQCRSLYLDALKIEKEAGRLSLQKEIYGVLLEASLKDKDFAHSTRYLTLRDSVNYLLVKQENDEKIKLIEDQYTLLTKENELSQEKKNNLKNKVMFGILSGFIFFLGLFLWQKNKNSKLKLKQEKLVLEQKVLQTQMNPHFIFNALTSVQKTIFDNAPVKSTAYLSKFAKLIRQNFEFVNKDEITLSEDLDALTNYIETQQFRFDYKFDYAFQIDKDIDPTFVNIPPMLIQPFVENAIEHGLKPKSGKGHLQINITRKVDAIRFDIIDDGIGLDFNVSDTDRYHAIDIFKKRLILRNLGEEKSFSLKSREDMSGTIVTFVLNLH